MRLFINKHRRLVCEEALAKPRAFLSMHEKRRSRAYRSASCRTGVPMDRTLLRFASDWTMLTGII